MNTEVTSSSFSQSMEGVEYAHAQAEASSKTEINETNRLTLVDFPEDLILRIFSEFSIQTLAELSIVCKRFKICADHDIVWRCLAETVFIPAEIQAKPTELVFKEFYITSALPQVVGRLELSSEESEPATDPIILLAPRDPLFIQRFKQMQLANYKLLDLSEMKELLSKPDTQALLQELSLEYNESTNKNHALPIQYVAQTQVGDIKFDIINCTNYLISFDAERHLLINNKLTDLTFTADDCQLLVYISKDKFWVKNRDLGNPIINRPRCKMSNILEMDKVDKIMGWYSH